MKEMIYLKDVCLSFGTGFSLDHLGFQVMAGEVYGFLGPSGAGKTTTMKRLTKQLNKSSGIIRVFGKDIEKMEREDFDQIGILSDTNGLYERMTIEENLQFFASLRQVPKKDVSRILHQIHLYDQKKTPLKKCSKGMKQRVVLAAAILHKPSLLFLDEPTSGLDPATIQAVHKMLMELNQEGTTIFLTTHNMEEADKLCGRIGILNQGSIIATGSPEDLKLHYAKEELLVTTADRQRITLPKTQEGFQELLALSEEGNLLTVHSKEPNLEEIFLELTGREF